MTCNHGFIGPCAECDGSGQIPDLDSLGEINPHMALGLSESRAARDDAEWSRWCREAEGELGVPTLDGDQDEDGYSLDYAHECYLAGWTPAEYAASVPGHDPEAI